MVSRLSREITRQEYPEKFLTKRRVDESSADLVLRHLIEPENFFQRIRLSAKGGELSFRVPPRTRTCSLSLEPSIPCARGGRSGTGVQCTLTLVVEHHDVLCGVMMIEGGPRLIPELGRRRVYHRDGSFPSSIPCRRRRPRFSARQHLIHTATTLSAIHSSIPAHLR